MSAASTDSAACDDSDEGGTSGAGADSSNGGGGGGSGSGAGGGGGDSDSGASAVMVVPAGAAGDAVIADAKPKAAEKHVAGQKGKKNMQALTMVSLLEYMADPANEIIGAPWLSHPAESLSYFKAIVAALFKKNARVDSVRRPDSSYRDKFMEFRKCFKNPSVSVRGCESGARTAQEATMRRAVQDTDCSMYSRHRATMSGLMETILEGSVAEVAGVNVKVSRIPAGGARGGSAAGAPDTPVLSRRDRVKAAGGGAGHLYPVEGEGAASGPPSRSKKVDAAAAALSDIAGSLKLALNFDAAGNGGAAPVPAPAPHEYKPEWFTDLETAVNHAASGNGGTIAALMAALTDTGLTTIEALCEVQSESEMLNYSGKVTFAGRKLWKMVLARSVALEAARAEELAAAATDAAAARGAAAAAKAAANAADFQERVGAAARAADAIKEAKRLERADARKAVKSAARAAAAAPAPAAAAADVSRHFQPPGAAPAAVAADAPPRKRNRSAVGGTDGVKPRAGAGAEKRAKKAAQAEAAAWASFEQ